MDTKTDRELIELAAKAAGVEVEFDADSDPHIDEPIGVFSGLWNPLRDDGDAFRLAVDLNLFGTPDLNHYLSVLSFIRGYDKYTLMRRAIVMAAAKIGEGME